ncbi:MAG: hypothetical protein CL881_03770, partial [Dehalococcoidia bacterium]|nr:hypothetical protein [Dehalococcoidia bacterium]
KISITKKTPADQDLTFTPDEEKKWAAACKEKNLPEGIKYTRLYWIFNKLIWKQSDAIWDKLTWSLPKKLKCARLKL